MGVLAGLRLIPARKRLGRSHASSQSGRVTTEAVGLPPHFSIITYPPLKRASLFPLASSLHESFRICAHEPFVQLAGGGVVVVRRPMESGGMFVFSAIHDHVEVRPSRNCNGLFIPKA